MLLTQEAGEDFLRDVNMKMIAPVTRMVRALLGWTSSIFRFDKQGAAAGQVNRQEKTPALKVRQIADPAFQCAKTLKSSQYILQGENL